MRGIKDLIDVDYIHKLNPEEKKWMLKFLSERYYAYFNSKGRGSNIHNKKQIRELRRELKSRLNDAFLRGNLTDENKE
jgi:hypothetical protein